MTRKVKEFRLFEKLTIESAGAEGHSIGRHDGQVIFVKYAAPGDVVLIAGKGHETTQTIAGVAHPFSDIDEVRAALAARTAAGAAA